MPAKNSNIYIPSCRICDGKSLLHIETMGRNGVLRDHYRIACTKCRVTTSPWLMIETALNKWVGA